MEEKTHNSFSAPSSEILISWPVTEKCFNPLNKIKQLIPYLGPAFVISVAYIDPGNFATNIQGGSTFNYTLVWVILWSNLMAIFLQSMSAKLGIATGCNLPQMCGKVFSKKLNGFFWFAAEFSAIATNLAEFMGASLGLYLLFHIPMAYAGLITAALTFFIVYLGKYGQRTVEIAITSLVAIICISYTVELFLAKPNFAAVGYHLLVPYLPNGEAVLVAVGMLGATVMPHVIYLHSELVQCRNKDCTLEDRRRHLRMERWDITIAMNIAFLINIAMVIVSAAVFYQNGIVVDTIEQAHHTLTPLLGAASSGAFGIALLASGLSSSAVGTMAGQTIVQGFVDLKLPDLVTKLIPIVPGMLIIMSGINPMRALLFSQVALSFVLPIAIMPMLWITSQKKYMGDFTNKKTTQVIGWMITLFIVGLNTLLLFYTLNL